MNSKIEFSLQELPEHTVLSVSGILDEYADLPALQSSEYRDLVIDLENLQSINSIGIRIWIDWHQTFHFRRVSFRKCPKVFVDQVNNVESFIPTNAAVLSFYVPYYSEPSDEDAQILFVRGEHFMDGKIVQLPYVLDSQNVQMDVDVVLEKYLRFLPRFPK